MQNITNKYELLLPEVLKEKETEEEYTWADHDEHINSIIRECVDKYNLLDTTVSHADVQKSDWLLSDDPVMFDGRDIHIVLLRNSSDKFLTSGANIYGEWHFLGNKREGETQQMLRNLLADMPEPTEEYKRLVMVGNCPKCSSTKTKECSGVEAIDDSRVGLCLDCGYLWCLDCGCNLNGQKKTECGHRNICDTCDEKKEEIDSSGEVVDFHCCSYMHVHDCDFINEWIKHRNTTNPN